MKPAIPKGTRDFSPPELAKRNFIFDTIRGVFGLYGYDPIETPSMENLSTLTGKYGDEGDKLIFKILNSGNFLSDVNDKLTGNNNPGDWIPVISEKALRYDLTVPFARYVVMNQHQITFPFRRYQIQPVWRADRPQKGRYREFYQCDADVIGTKSLLCETELILLTDQIFHHLGIKVSVRINNRKLLNGIAEAIGASEFFGAITVALDKLDKVSFSQIEADLMAAGMTGKAVQKLAHLLEIKGNATNVLSNLEAELIETADGPEGIEELREIMDNINRIGLKSSALELDIHLARGLNYYTGTILEVKADNKPGYTISLCGGGRYDDLTGIFGLQGMSGVGISFGADRIYDLMCDHDLFPEIQGQSTQVLFVNFGKEESIYCLSVVQQLRMMGIKAELFPEPSKMKKQMSYADQKKIPFVVLAGSEEIRTGILSLKNMITGEQTQVEATELHKKLI